MRWGGGRIRHAHRRRDDQVRLVAECIAFVVVLFLVVAAGSLVP